MKNLYLFLIVLFITEITFGQQNESDGFVANSISSPAPISGEIFRFQSGVVTQLDQGSTFSTSSRFFTLGRFINGAQTTYGLNFIVNGKGVGFGYPSLTTLNPQIVWKGDGSSNLGDLEFRYASSFTPGNTELTATMRNNGSTIFGPQSVAGFDETMVGIFSRRKFGLSVYIPSSDSSSSFAGYFENEAPISDNFAVAGKAGNADDRNFAVYGSAGTGGSSSALNYGVYGEA